jgi:hypothetical protein
MLNDEHVSKCSGRGFYRTYPNWTIQISRILQTIGNLHRVHGRYLYTANTCKYYSPVNQNRYGTSAANQFPRNLGSSMFQLVGKNHKPSPPVILYMGMSQNPKNSWYSWMFIFPNIAIYVLIHPHNMEYPQLYTFEKGRCRSFSTPSRAAGTGKKSDKPPAGIGPTTWRSEG